MKRTIVSVALVLALSMSAFAGNRDRKECKERCEFPCEQMVKDLNLSDKQVKQLKEADETFAAEVKAIREKRREFQNNNRESMKEAKERRDSTLKSVLTKDQYIQYLEQRLERRGRRPDGSVDRNARPMNRHFDGKRHKRPDCPFNRPAPDAPAPETPAPTPEAPAGK